MNIPRQITPSQPLAPRTSEQSEAVSETASFQPDQGLAAKIMDLPVVPTSSREMSFITDQIMSRGGSEGPEVFTKVLFDIMRQTKQSKFNTGDVVQDVFAFLKLRDDIGGLF